MEKSEALKMLVQAYRDEIDWLMARAKEHEAKAAAEFVHRARNLRAILDEYERVTAKNPWRPEEVGGYSQRGES